jgi:hypothetical protein
LQLAKDSGNDPSNSLPFKSRLLILFPSVNDPGMVPWKLLLLKFNTDSSVLKFPKHCGILPLKLLLDKFMIWKVVILQIQGGISPVSLLFAIKRMYMDCGRIGNGC